jgi:orotidine-5'-phosphate decarboxylase
MVREIRQKYPDHFFLVPGVGAQGGSLAEISMSGLNRDCGLLVNASRAIIFSANNEDFAAAASLSAEQYHQEMRRYMSTITG